MRNITNYNLTFPLSVIIIITNNLMLTSYINVNLSLLFLSENYNSFNEYIIYLNKNKIFLQKRVFDQLVFVKIVSILYFLKEKNYYSFLLVNDRYNNNNNYDNSNKFYSRYKNKEFLINNFTIRPNKKFFTNHKIRTEVIKLNYSKRKEKIFIMRSLRKRIYSIR